jgi:hypothetical protein
MRFYIGITSLVLSIFNNIIQLKGYPAQRLSSSKAIQLKGYPAQRLSSSKAIQLKGYPAQRLEKNTTIEFNHL